MAGDRDRVGRDGPGLATVAAAASVGPATWGVVAGVLVVLALLATLMISIVSVAGGAAQMSSSGCAGGAGAAVMTGTVKGAPANLIPIYEQAAAKYQLGPEGPSMLAAVNYVETGYGTNMGPSSAGAIGWMQFMPETWEAYGVDGNGDGAKDPENPWDGIYSAAYLLSESGAPQSWHDALFSYNHAEWYVTKVMTKATELRGTAPGAAVPVAAAATCTPTAGPDSVRRIIAEADRIDALRLTYVWGGSHGITPTPANGPFDCSSAVSHLLQVAGFELETMPTARLINWGEPGPGALVTIHIKAYGMDAHTFLEFSPQIAPPERRYWGTSSLNPGRGPGWISEESYDAGYLSGFELRHAPGL